MGEMADYIFDAFYNIDTFDEIGLEPPKKWYKRACHQKNDSDPYYYSRKAAICEICGAAFTDLCVSVSLTAANARREGWQIERIGPALYSWYCPKCKAVHDFKDVVYQTTTATQQEATDDFKS